ncbi:hypothetical protein [Bombilactobacillus apium]|uniref:hypothetical protein n=1 Tax=Bombilactobacillus apium TaxID=2675299 RepID=UPI001E39A0BC|nr:hypothetical protein [Bombilactobacillus apium]
MGDLNYYSDLLQCSYTEAIETVRQKHGLVKDNYFLEKSYYRFLNGEIKNITPGKYKRTKEGLYCHHIDENKALNLGNKTFIKKYSYPYSMQVKERLVYVDAVEHLILHALITFETKGEFGFPGYVTMLEPSFQDWYIQGNIPNPSWRKACYDRAFLNSDDAKSLLSSIRTNLLIGYHPTLEELQQVSFR